MLEPARGQATSHELALGLCGILPPTIASKSQQEHNGKEDAQSLEKPLKTIEKMLAGESVVIVALGDSLTSGWMVGKGYLDFLREHIAALYPNAVVELINAGSPGDTAYDGLYRLPADVLEHNPDCVLVQFGLNDALCMSAPAQFGALIRKIVAEIRLAGDIDIVLVTSSYLGSNELGDYVELFYEQLEKIAAEGALSVVATHKYWLERIQQGLVWEHLVQDDRVHPTVAGHALMAAALREVFTVCR